MNLTQVAVLLAVLVAHGCDAFAFVTPISRSNIACSFCASTSGSRRSSSGSNSPEQRRQQQQSSTRLYGFGDLKGLAQLFNPAGKGDEKPLEPKFETVVIEPDFRCAAIFLALGVLLDVIPYIQFLLGIPVTLLGFLVLYQTFRSRFLFDEVALELATVGGVAGELVSSGENVVVGGSNRWTTDSIVNYEFFPKGWIDGPTGPILVYFKETQTPSDKWNEGPGKLANDEAKVASGEVQPGQVHFFPAICNAQQIRDEFEKRGCRKI